jgi:hypothetical protein
MADEPVTEQPYVDPHLKVPYDEWGQVVRDAEKFRKEREANQ